MFRPICGGWYLSVLMLTLVVFAIPVQAGTITVNSSGDLPGVFSGGFPAGGSIQVTGYRPGNNYDGEGHVVGSMVNGSFVALNLTAYNGKAFIINDRSGGSDRITMVSNFAINSISFDYEIFPNADVANGTGRDPNTTPRWPDFTFKADGVTYLHTLGVMPGTNGTSTLSASMNPETAPQFVGSSGVISLPGVTRLEFIDWPPTIGVNNIQFGSPPPPPPPIHTPEPGSVIVFSLVMVGAGVYGVRRR